ncbi:MAG: PilZ domain-containing protein [Nitrospirae bacterium]|nr:PilZ domain-containing protein [Nitrospirota bacterium]
MEQRDIHRIHRRVLARFGPDYPDHVGEVVDLSSGGMRIESETVFPVETPLVIELFFSGAGAGQRSILVRGIVVRSPGGGSGMGVQLLQVSEDYLNFMKEFYLPGRRSL